MKTTSPTTPLTRVVLPVSLLSFTGAMFDNLYRSALLVFFAQVLIQQPELPVEQLTAASPGVFILPYLLFTPLFGYLGDLYPKRNLLMIAKLIELPILLLIAVCFHTSSVYLLMVLLFCAGTQSAFFGPIKRSILPELVDKHSLLPLNGTIETANFTGILLGSVLGSALIVWGTDYVALALLFTTVCGFTAAFFTPKPSLMNTQKSTWRDGLRPIAQIKSILHMIRALKLETAMLAIACFWFIGAILLSQIPLIAVALYGPNEWAPTYLLLSFVVGLLIGGLTAKRLFQLLKRKAEQLASVLLVTAGALITGIVSGMIPKALVLPALSLMATSGAWLSIPAYAWIQSCSEREQVSRLIAGSNLLNALAMITASLLSMFVFKQFDSLVLVIGLTVAAAGLYTCIVIRSKAGYSGQI